MGRFQASRDKAEVMVRMEANLARSIVAALVRPPRPMTGVT